MNKYGPRACIIVGNLLTAAGLASLYFIHGLWQLYLIYVFIGFMAGFGGYIPCTTIANNWFIGKRALAMSVVTAAAGAGGLFYPPITTALIQAFQWRMTWLILAIAVAVFTIVSGLLIRNRPEDKGQLPEGYANASPKAPEETLPATGAEVWKLSSIFKIPVTYLILGFIIGNAFVMGTMNTHQIAYVQDIGFSAMTAATTMSVFAVLGLIGSLGFGVLALKIQLRYLAAAGLLSEVIGLIILLTTKSEATLFIYVVFIGLGTGALFAALPSFTSTYYPREHYARVTGLFLPFHVVAQAIIAWVVGKMYDSLGSYTLAFTIIAVCATAGAVCAFLARQPKIQS